MVEKFLEISAQHLGVDKMIDKGRHGTCGCCEEESIHMKASRGTLMCRTCYKSNEADIKESAKVDRIPGSKSITKKTPLTDDYKMKVIAESVRKQ